MKTDAEGNKEWDHTFGGPDWDWAHSVQQTADGGFIIAGETFSFGAGAQDSWLVKTDAAGNKEWDRTFGGTGWEDARSVQQTADGGFIFAGRFCVVHPDFWLVKVAPEGVLPDPEPDPEPEPEPEPAPPVALFTASIEKPAVHQTVLFDASASYDPDGEIVSYHWGFGDGTSQSGVRVHHKYREAGDFTVRLTVKDNEGQTASREMTLAVLEPVRPVIEAVLPRVEGIALEGIRFENTYTAHVRSETPISKVIFRVGDRTFTDTDGGDGWSAVIDMGILEGVSVLEVIAVDEKGIESEPYTLRIRVIGLPEWLIHVIELGGVSVSREGRIEFSRQIPDPPVDASLHLPDSIPVIGGPQRFKASSEFYIVYEMPSGTAIVGGEGILEITVLGREAEGRIGAEGTIDATNFELKRARIWVYVEIEAWSKRWGVEIPIAGRLDFDVGISPHARLEGRIVAEPSLNLEGATISPGIKVEGETKVPMPLVNVEIETEGGVTGSINVPAPYDPRVTASIWAHGRAQSHRFDVEIKIGPFEYQYPEPEVMLIPERYVKITQWEVVEKYGRTPLSGAEPVGPLMAPQVPAESAYGRLTLNNIEDESPAVVHLGEGEYLVVWSAQDPAKDVWAGHDLFYASYDASGWSEIRRLTDDDLDDRDPVLAKWGDEVISVWTRVNRAFTAEEAATPFDVFPYYEIAYTILNDDWLPLTLTTDDAELDFGAVTAAGIIAWQSDGDSDPATTEDQSVRGIFLDTGLSFEIPNASHPSLAGSAVAYFDQGNQRVVFGKLMPELEIVASYDTSDFSDLALAYYDGSYTLVWVDELRMFSASPPESPETIETLGSVYTVDVMDFGRYQLVSFTGKLPGEARQRIFYKIRYDDVWIKQRTLVGGTDLTFWQADYAEGIDGFFAVFAGKELIEDKNDIFYVFHRYAGDLEISAAVEGDYSPGDSVTISYTVRNIGDQPAPAFTVSISNLEMEELSSRSFEGLDPGTSLSDSFTVTLDESGGFVLEALATPDLDPDNNSVALRLLHPDLLVREVEESRRGEELTLTVTFENIGYIAAAGAGFEFLSGDETLYSGVVDVPARGTTTYAITIDVGKIDRSLTSGVWIDPENHIREENEENNLLQFRSLMADLSLEKEAIRAIKDGDNILLRVLVKNKGTGDAEGHLTLLDQELNPVRYIEFQIKGMEELAVFEEIETTLSPEEWDKVYYVGAESLYGDGNDKDNIAPVERILLQLPEATFTFNPPVPLVGQEVSFNAGQSYDADGNIRQYIWRFGDGNVVIGDHPVVEHTYPEAGDYTVSLTVVDNDGLTSSTSRSLQVVPPPAVVTGRVHLQGRTDHSGATVSINGYSTTTNPDGSLFLDLPAGTYTIIASIPGYLPAAKPDVVLEGGVTHVLETVTLLGGDVSGDGVINAADLARIAANFNTPDPDSDINADGLVDIYDLVLAGLNFGKSSSPWD